jgi:hypothetical protein
VGTTTPVGVRRLLRIRCDDLLITNPQPWDRVYGCSF